MAQAKSDKHPGTPQGEKAIDEVIHDLIVRRKLQQEALVKIKTAVEKRQSTPRRPGPSNENQTTKP